MQAIDRKTWDEMTGDQQVQVMLTMTPTERRKLLPLLEEGENLVVEDQKQGSLQPVKN